MRAILLNKHGGPEVLEMADVPDPTAGWGEAVVRVKACGLNHLDVWVRRGIPGLKIDYPHILGSDIAGVVEEIRAPAGAPVQAGDRVVVFPSITCSYCDACLSGRDDMCGRRKLMGENTGGGYAEKVRVPVRNLFKLPDSIDYMSAACLPVAYVTAWHMLTSRAQVRPGEWVLITAAASGVSTGAIQMARILQARVIAAASSDRKLERAAEWGAEAVVNTSKPDWPKEVRRIVGGRGVDLIVDHVGQSNWDAYIRLLTWGGRIVICGASSGHEALTDLRHVFFRRLSIIGSTMGSLFEFRQVLDYVAQGRVKPVIYRTLPLEQAGEAHRILEDREVIGKVVLEVS